MSWKPSITIDEHAELTDAGYMIRHHWIMPGSYYEYYLIRMGGRGGIHDSFTAKSPRACYSYFKKHITQEQSG